MWDETLEEDIVAGFGGYERLRAEDTFGITTQGKETSAWLSMLRKLHLANELRRVRVRVTVRVGVGVGVRVRVRVRVRVGVRVRVRRRCG